MGVEYRFTLSLNLALDGVAGQHHVTAALPPEIRLSAHFTGGWVDPRLVWTGARNLAPTGIRSQDRPVRSKSLSWPRLHHFIF